MLRTAAASPVVMRGAMRPVATASATAVRAVAVAALPHRCRLSTSAAAWSAAADASSTAASVAAPTITPAARRTSARPSLKEAATEGAQRSFALRLYKAIMRAHRTVLPEAMRSLGDTYVREEFKLHKTAKPEHLHGFFTAWIGYLEMMRTQAPGAWGKSLSADETSALSDEQKAQLELLQKSAANLDAQWSGMEQEQNPVTIPSTEGRQ